ncbi:MAG: transposase [bacterium]|nr:transposase [bacterium]
MPRRVVPLVNGEIYHVINRGNASEKIFRDERDFQRFIETLIYYQCAVPPFKFSLLKKLPFSEKAKIFREIREGRDFIVEILAYCLMSNHYHLILRQRLESGVYNFARLTANSYAHYFNLKNQRRGSLFESRFKALRVHNEFQLLHLSRYVHLNPLSASLVDSYENLLKYQYSSLTEYLGRGKEAICERGTILSQFKSGKDYESFVRDRADYQRSLEEIKHLI